MRVCVETSAFQIRFAGIAYYAWFLLQGLCEEGDELEIWGFNGLNFHKVDKPYLEQIRALNEIPREPARIDRGRLYGVGRRIPMARELYRRIKAVRFARRMDEFDLFHAVNYVPPSGYFGPTLPLVHDLSHERFPETHPAERVQWLRQRLSGLHKCSVIQTVSRFSADEIADFYGIERSRITATYPGANPAYSPIEQSDDWETLDELRLTARSYFLVVGTLEPRKNLKTVLKAFSTLPKQTRIAHPLVVVGQPGWGDAGLSGINALLEEGSVRILGYQSVASLAALYRHARTMVFPSVYEGFGIPTVEALASGKRPILSNIPIMREVADTSADFVEPLAVDGWAASLAAAIDDSRYEDHTFQAQSIKRAQNFDWSSNARQTIALYKDAKLSFDSTNSKKRINS